MTDFTPITALIGGSLIGISAVVFLLFNGRIAGISSIISGAFKPVSTSPQWRWCFLLGLILSPLFISLFSKSITIEIDADWSLLAIAGFLVGFGSYLGSGCTSGHGICGIGRLSPRSIVATCIFMAVAVFVVFITKHLI